MRGEVEQRAAGEEQPDQRERPPGRLQRENRARHERQLLGLFVLLRRDAVEHDEVGRVHREQHGRVAQAE
jgi:hypothetical protein